NVEQEKTGPIFTFYQELIRLRKELPLISEGDYKAAYKDSQKVYAFERLLNDEKLLVLNNFFAEEVELDLADDYAHGQVLISNYPDNKLGKKIILKPYQALAIQVK
ncbi:alpha-glucosidase C-terminal domain-containing protein, partial [Streptococcus suis]